MSASTLNAGSPQVIKMSDVELEEIAVGTKVSFGRPESMVEPAVGYVEKVNRMTTFNRIKSEVDQADCLRSSTSCCLLSPRHVRQTEQSRS